MHLTNLKQQTHFIDTKTYKFTWQARGTRSVIDYIIINEGLKIIVHDTRVSRESKIDSDNKLDESNFKFFTQAQHSYKKTKNIQNTSSI